MKFFQVFIFFSAFSFSAVNHAENIGLEPIVIEKGYLSEVGQFGSSISLSNIEQIPYSSPEELPDYLIGVELKKRAPFGIQQDISIRGSNFEDNRVELEGVNINDPQTGHFSLEIPLTSADIEEVGVDKGRQSLNYRLRKPKGKGLLLKNSFGQHSLWENLLSSNFKLGDIKNRVSVEHKTSSGARQDTDFEIYNFSFHSLWQKSQKEVEFIFGATKRDFGAGSFYSASFPHEEEHITQQFYLLRGKLEHYPFDLESTAYFRRHTDKFILNRYNPSFYTNYHTTYVYGLKNRISFKNTFFLDLDLRKEKITSTNLGWHSRLKKGLSVGVYKQRIGDFTYDISCGFSYYGRWNYLKNAHLDLGYYIREDLKLRFSYDRIWRVPSFTELYYSSPSNVGNILLDVQKSNNYEVGLESILFDNLKIYSSAFMKKQSDTIDWIKNNQAGPWQAVNIGSIQARGFDFYGEVDFEDNFFKSAGIGYTYLDLDKENRYSFSKYVFDYSRHKAYVNFGCNFWEVSSDLRINFSNPVSRSRYTTVDLKVYKKYAGLDVALEGVNIFNRDYQEGIDTEGTGRWYKVSFTYSF